MCNNGRLTGLSNNGFDALYIFLVWFFFIIIKYWLLIGFQKQQQRFAEVKRRMNERMHNK